MDKSCNKDDNNHQLYTNHALILRDYHEIAHDYLGLVKVEEIILFETDLISGLGMIKWVVDKSCREDNNH